MTNAFLHPCFRLRPYDILGHVAGRGQTLLHARSSCSDRIGKHLLHQSLYLFTLIEGRTLVLRIQLLDAIKG